MSFGYYIKTVLICKFFSVCVIVSLFQVNIIIKYERNDFVNKKAMPIIYGVGAAMAIGTAAAISKAGKKKTMKKKVKKTANKAINAVGNILDNIPGSK